mmetsp:Transcript_34380/g.76358  ORF Transcript_34380/g.76358 Transcript_34380/m.76358 type:complete len:148 (-) Transcript_34380:424-867(-)
MAVMAHMVALAPPLQSHLVLLHLQGLQMQRTTSQLQSLLRLHLGLPQQRHEPASQPSRSCSSTPSSFLVYPAEVAAPSALATACLLPRLQKLGLDTQVSPECRKWCRGEHEWHDVQPLLLHTCRQPVLLSSDVSVGSLVLSLKGVLY